MRSSGKTTVRVSRWRANRKPDSSALAVSSSSSCSSSAGRTGAGSDASLSSVRSMSTVVALEASLRHGSREADPVPRISGAPSMTAPGERERTTTAAAGPAAPSGRTLVLVAGSGRSGTSLFTGIMQRLGFHVPQPEVPADATNPRGFAESKWVVDFHIGLLDRAVVQVADARPAAWAHTARVAHEDGVRRQLREWLTGEFANANPLIIKAPRLSWFLPLWRQCAE